MCLFVALRTARLNVGSQSAMPVQFFFIYHMVFICLPHRLAFKLYSIFQGNCLGSPPPPSLANSARKISWQLVNNILDYRLRNQHKFTTVNILIYRPNLCCMDCVDDRVERVYGGILGLWRGNIEKPTQHNVLCNSLIGICLRTRITH